MNIRVIFVLFLGILSIAALLVYPPWKAHGQYAGHIRIDRVAWLELDHTRLYVELGLIIVTTILVAIKLWGKNPKK